MSAPYGGGNDGKKTGKLDVKNKTPAPVQITAEQLLREAVERQTEEVKPPVQRIADSEELQAYRVRKRKEYEDWLRRQAHHVGTWIKYGQWEAEQKEFRRARSVFERALNIDYQNVTLWLKYIEMETQNTFINSARNLYDRACKILPRVDQFWMKYAHMEELLGNYSGSRSVYEKWMDWVPDDKAWSLYIHFEERCKEIERARNVFERYLCKKPSQESFLKFCKFEERLRNRARCRAGFEKAIECLDSEDLNEKFYIKFAEFETRCNELDRAQLIYKEALARLPKHDSEVLYSSYVSFQKQHGGKNEIEETILAKRRFYYEDQIKDTPQDYDVWFDYLRLEENAGEFTKIRELYERAVANMPPCLKTKNLWRRYIYFWINYALFEEIVAQDMTRCREVYETALNLIPKAKFTFAKLYTLYAEFETRQLNIDKARKIYGRAIAECGKDTVFNIYAALELRLGNIDRCRTIYAKYIEKNPFKSKAWIALIELELVGEEYERAVAICKLAIDMEEMDFPEMIWQQYIDLETCHGTPQGVRNVYEKLLLKTQHFKVFVGYADFEIKCEEIENARKILERGTLICKEREQNEERCLLLEKALEIERQTGDEAKIAEVFGKLPKKVKRKRPIFNDHGEQEGFEEYLSYVFPDDGTLSANLGILEAARAWKKRQQDKASAS